MLSLRLGMANGDPHRVRDKTSGFSSFWMTLFYCILGEEAHFCVASQRMYLCFFYIAHTEDDALYPVLNWNKDRRGATIVSAFVICILSPGLFYACWALSLSSSTRSCGGDEVEDIIVIDQDKHQLNTTTTTTKRGCCCCNFDGSRRPLYDPNTTEELNPDYKIMENMVIV